MKLSDYVVDFLHEKGIKDAFLLAGGGIMHLLDSIAKSDINKYYNLHEQASAFAADGYGQFANKPALVLATTGPGATNTITGVASAYIDSIPMIVITGQVKRADITKIKGVRQTGGQEIDIVSMAKGIAKYAKTILDENTIKYELEKAWHLANTGRKGPVLLDIPLDVQAQDINPDTLESYIAKDQAPSASEVEIQQVYELLKSAERPCLLVGSGVVLADAKNDLIKLVNAMQIPTVSSQRVKRLFSKENARYYYGSVGVVDSRAGNYVLQNSDLLLVLGSGLRYYMTAYNEPGFAPKAKKIIVNIHQPEIEKLRMPVEQAVVSDAGAFIRSLYTWHIKQQETVGSEKWHVYCDRVRDKYRFDINSLEHDAERTDGYLVTNAINKYAADDDIFFISSSAYDYPYNVYSIHDNQDQICPIGLGSMGATLPQVIGVAAAAGKRRVLVGEGDGSLQHNIQELALLRTYSLPIKLFVDNNSGYAQIRNMQNRHFHGNLAGCDETSGVEFPNLELIAKAYNIPYYSIRTVAETEEKVQKALADNEPAIIEIFSSKDTEIVPIIKSRMGENGKMISAALEDMYPFVSKEEQIENMSISNE